MICIASYFYFFILGLAIRVKLLRSLPPRFKVDVRIRPGTHASELAVNKQAALDGHFFENTMGLLTNKDVIFLAH